LNKNDWLEVCVKDLVMPSSVMIRILICLLALYFGTELKGQTTISDLFDSLQFSTESLMMDKDIVIRQKSMEDTKTLIDRILDRDDSYEIGFDSIQRISVQYPADSSFRIFTGQLFLSEDKYRYYGILQRRDNERHPIVLRDGSDVIRSPKEEQLTAENWYGAVYYNLKQFDHEGARYYLMFGYNAFSLYQRQKLVEVLTFDDHGMPLFGAPVFEYPGHEGIHRFILQYSSDVGVGLNYDDELQMIVFDHLIPMKSPYQAQSVALVPDGSYCAFTFDGGKWKYVPKVFHEILSEPPRDKPVFNEETKSKDIFGRKKN